MRIVLFASGEFAIPTLRSLSSPRQADHTIVCVITQPDKVAGRGKKAKPTPVKTEALELGMKVISATNVNDPEVIEQLRMYNADLGLVIAFGQKMGEKIRTLFPHQCINLHASLLPQFRGAAPFQWSIIRGEERVGVTTFRLAERMDAGDVYVQRWTLRKEDERACELHDRLAMIGVDAVNATLEILQENPGFLPTPQDETLATKAPKLSKEDGYITFNCPATQLSNLICGLWSWPGAKCMYTSQETGRSEQVTIALARVGDPSPAADPPGTVDYRRYVATADGYLEILEIQPAGKRLMSFEDFVNGRRMKAGDRFTSVE